MNFSRFFVDKPIFAAVPMDSAVKPGTVANITALWCARNAEPRAVTRCRTRHEM